MPLAPMLVVKGTGHIKIVEKSNRKAMNSNWSNQKPNPALKTKMGKNKNYK